MTIIMSCCMWQLASLLCVCLWLPLILKYARGSKSILWIRMEQHESHAHLHVRHKRRQQQRQKSENVNCTNVFASSPLATHASLFSPHAAATSLLFLAFFSSLCELFLSHMQIANCKCDVCAARVNYVNGSGVISLAPLCTLSLSPYPSPSPRNWHFNCRRCQDQLTLYVVSSSHPSQPPPWLTSSDIFPGSTHHDLSFSIFLFFSFTLNFFLVSSLSTRASQKQKIIKKPNVLWRQFNVAIEGRANYKTI